MFYQVPSEFTLLRVFFSYVGLVAEDVDGEVCRLAALYRLAAAPQSSHCFFMNFLSSCSDCAVRNIVAVRLFTISDEPPSCGPQRCEHGLRVSVISFLSVSCQSGDGV